MKQRPFILGLTGLACAGKSAAASALSALGASVIDVDKVGHEALHFEEVKKKIRAQFGSEVFAADGTLNRKALGQLAFSNDNTLQALEEIIHPAMIASVKQRVAAASECVVVIDAAILHYLGLNTLCDKVILLSAPFSQRLERARSRNWSEQELKLRDEAFNSRLPAAADPSLVTIENSGTLPQLQNEISSLWKDITHG